MKQDAFLNNIKAQLDHDCEQLDQSSLERLKNARQDAVQAAQKPSLSLWQRLMPAPSYKPWLAGFSSISIAIVAVLYWHQPEHIPEASLFAQDFEILAADIELDEDLEFYDWLETQHG